MVTNTKCFGENQGHGANFRSEVKVIVRLKTSNFIWYKTSLYAINYLNTTQAA